MIDDQGQPAQGTQTWPWLSLVALSLAVYANSFMNPFMLDDYELISNNPLVGNWRQWWVYIIQPFDVPSASGFSTYRPVEMFSHGIDQLVWGFRPFGFHLTNWALHAMASVLAYNIYRRVAARWTLHSQWVAWAAAALFVLHPIHVEAVSLISARNELLMLVCYLTPILLWMERRHWPRYVGGAGAILLWCVGLLSKEMAVTLPLTLWLTERCLSHAQTWDVQGAWRRYRGWWMVLATYLVARMVLPASLMASDWWGGSPWVNFLTMVPATALYYQLLCFPLHLSWDHALPLITSLRDPRLWCGGAILSGVVGVCVASWRKRTDVSWGICWTAISLLPVLNIMPFWTLFAERYAYLPSVGFCYVLARGLYAVGRWLSNRQRSASYGHALAVGPLVVVLVVFGVLTIQRNAEWREPMAFWETEVQTSPQSVKAWLHLGKHYARSSRFEEAEHAFRQVLAIQPGMLAAYAGLGGAHMLEGRWEDAKRELLKGYSSETTNSTLLWNLSTVHLHEHDWDAARAVLTRLVKHAPHIAKAHYHLALLLAYAESPEWDGAMVHAESAARLGYSQAQDLVDWLNQQRFQRSNAGAAPISPAQSMPEVLQIQGLDPNER